ncbi:MAG: protein kinase [Acidobacteriota bacterium]
MGKVPDRLGPYQIRGAIGSGGMGVVYLGWDSRLRRKVAIKTLWPELARQAEARARFLREARSAAALSHPHLVSIYDVGEEQGQVFFAMEYLEGQSLQRVLRDCGKMDPARAVALVRQAADGLGAAARRGIVHRDIKPANLVLGAGGMLKVTDFGLARQMAADSGLTLTGQVLGSPHYMAPELALGTPAGVASDTYSLGVTLYEMVTGRPPFQGPTPVAVILKHVNEPLRRFNPDLPYPVVSLLQRLLAKDPRARPADYDALIQELDRVAAALAGERKLPGVFPAPPPALGSRPARKSARSLLPMVAGLLALAVVAGWWNDRSRAPAVPARSLNAVSPDAETRMAPPAASPLPPAPTAPPAGTLPGESRISPTPEEAPSRQARLRIDHHEYEFLPTGQVRVFGSVTNQGRMRASGSRVRVRLTQNGREIGSREVSVAPPLLGPGDSGEFEAVFPPVRGGFKIHMELHWLY